MMWRRLQVAPWVLGVTALAAVTAALVPFRLQIGETPVAFAYLLVVLGASAWGGRAIGVVMSIASFILFNWFFLAPFHTLQLRDPLDGVVLAGFLATSLIAAQLLYRARAERAAVERAESLRETDKMKDVLVASLSHDLRTPLTTIKGLAHELQELGDERTFIIEEEADRLNRIVSDLLDSARLDHGNLPLNVELNAADELLGAVIRHFAGRPDRDRLVVRLDDPSALSFGRFDLVHSLRILANLVDNALKYSPPGLPVELTAAVEKEMLVFRVTDHGPGISKADQVGIFLPFNRSAPGRSGQSLGLGLSIARRLAEAQRGTLGCFPGQNDGMIFELRLPAVDPLTLS
jgi:K+-sensing histidine kinase KdpD